jgi:putative ABC transport system ATP-binding protein
MNIVHRTRHYPVQLSGGQQQSVAVARATVSAPKLRLSDEPIGILDSPNGAELMSLLREINREGSTIVVVVPTHSAQDATFATRVVNMLDGKLSETSVPAQTRHACTRLRQTCLVSAVNPSKGPGS